MSMAEAMLKAGIIKQEDVDRVARQKRIQKEEERKAWARKAARERIESGEAQVQFRAKARPLVRKSLAKIMEAKLGKPKDHLDIEMRKAALEVSIEWELDNLAQAAFGGH